MLSCCRRCGGQYLCAAGKWSDAVQLDAPCTSVCDAVSASVPAVVRYDDATVVSAPLRSYSFIARSWWRLQGFVCVPGSSTPRAAPCGNASVFCPAGSGAPTPVGAGNYSTGNASTGSAASMTAQAVCPAPAAYANVSVYCPGPGVGVMIVCPGGRFGTAAGLSSSLCSGECAPGYFCPDGSVSPQQQQCGGIEWCVLVLGCVPHACDVCTYHIPSSSLHRARVDVLRYCAAGSASRSAVPSGYYSTPLTASPLLRVGVAQCVAGEYCSGGERRLCDPGTYEVDRLRVTPCTTPCAAGAVVASTRSPCPLTNCSRSLVSCSL